MTKSRLKDDFRKVCLGLNGKKKSPKLTHSWEVTVELLINFTCKAVLAIKITKNYYLPIHKSSTHTKPKLKS